MTIGRHFSAVHLLIGTHPRRRRVMAPPLIVGHGSVNQLPGSFATTAFGALPAVLGAAELERDDDLGEPRDKAKKPTQTRITTMRSVVLP
jgi:hypothetical protein